MQLNTDFFGCKKENFELNNFYIFRFSAQNIGSGYTFEMPRRDGSNVYPQSMFWIKNKKQ